jgi:hypothetical protein
MSNADTIREFTRETPPPRSCYGVMKPEGTFPIDQPLLRQMALEYVESQIQLAAYKRFECPDTAARMAASQFQFQMLAAKVAACYILEAVKDLERSEENAEV